MNKISKTLLWIFGWLLALVVIVIIGLKLFFPVEKVKALAM